MAKWHSPSFKYGRGFDLIANGVIQPPSSDSSFYKRNSIWFGELELDYGYLMTYCLSGREIAGVWKLARLVTAD